MKGGDFMAKHVFDIFSTLCIYYFIFVEISYFYFKLRKDKRFENVKFFKYLSSPIEILRGKK